MAGSFRGVISRGRVAVVTGAASGIGLGLSERFAAEAMKVVMADVEAPALEASAARIAAQGGDVIPVVTDVSKADQVDALRDRALAAYGAVHVLCNNAGVGGPHGPLWDASRGDWEWVLGVNLWGVINGIRSFMPVLLAQDAAHVVNTSSVFGVFAGALGPYGISKHAVTALSETLYFNLRQIGAAVGVSVLCPGAVKTNFGSSARNRPPELGPSLSSEAVAAAKEQFERLAVDGSEPSEVAEIVVEGIREGRFYLLTSNKRAAAIVRRGEEVVAGGPPLPPFP